MNARPVAALALIVSIFAAAPAFAEDVGQHPAVFAARGLPGVNPSTFVVGHPASPTNRAGHANSDHPAVTVARRALGVDANTFVVQPPAATAWALRSAPDDAALAVASALPAAR